MTQVHADKIARHLGLNVCVLEETVPRIVTTLCLHLFTVVMCTKLFVCHEYSTLSILGITFAAITLDATTMDATG